MSVPGFQGVPIPFPVPVGVLVVDVVVKGAGGEGRPMCDACAEQAAEIASALAGLVNDKDGNVTAPLGVIVQKVIDALQ